MTATPDLTIHVATDRDMQALGQRIAPCLRAGDTVLLDGDIGAGKSVLARAVIQMFLGLKEEVPSPTFTIVQVYDVGSFDIWHCDLYRLNGPDGVVELGLDQAYAESVCLIEWPDRLGPLAPPNPLNISVTTNATSDVRQVTFASNHVKWQKLLKACA